MAEENRSTRNTFEDMMFALFALLLVGQALERLPILMEEKFGFSFGGGEYLVASAALSSETPLGTRVSTVHGAEYFDEAGASGQVVGSFPPGASLVLADGPTTGFGGSRWWYVEDPASGEAGWVPESALTHEGIGGIGPNTALGSKVRAMMDVDAWNTPGGLTKVGSLVKGELGELIKGPTVANGSRWWYFDRADSDEDGWVTEAALLLTTDANWQVGSAVRMAAAADLFERAGGGRAIGYLEKGIKAKIIGGPVDIGGTAWWLVETEDGTQGWVSENVLEAGGVRGWLKGVLATLLVVGILFALVLLGGIVYATIRTNQIRAREAKRIKNAIPATMLSKRNERWDTVQTHMTSDNPNDWRLAIIESDVMLDELITRMGYRGTTLGDKLKQVTRGDVRSVDAAWEAHRVRNQIAHEGSDFILTQREARRVIELYGAVFKEFKYI